MCFEFALQLQRFLVLKGAPEIVLEKCSTFMRESKTVAIDDEFKKEYERAYKYHFVSICFTFRKFGVLGERVLGLAYLPLKEKGVVYSKEEKNFPLSGITSS